MNDTRRLKRFKPTDLPTSDPVQLDKYRTFDEVNDYITNVLSKNKELCSELNIGKSYENRDIRGMKISDGSLTNKAIVLDGGIHAREWVSTAAVLYTVHQLLTNSSHSDLIRGLDWFILPILNPDGYVFSMLPSGDRQWRKNRGDNAFSSCRGVDLNRNFDYAWGGPGSSNNPCDPDYRGAYPFSEPESKALAGFFRANLDKIRMYLTLHSAAQALIYPWGFTHQPTEDWEDLDILAQEAALRMSEVNGTIYYVGSTTNIVGPGAGGSDDWAKGLGVKYVYTMELPGLYYPEGGFHPPESDLDVIMKETFKGIQYFASELKSMRSV